MRFIRNRDYIQADGSSLNVGTMMLMMLVTPKLTDDGEVKQGADYEQARKMRKAIRSIRGETGTECAIPLGDYIRLEDAVYEHLISQAKAWRWSVVDPTVVDMIEDWIDAPEDEPLVLGKNGHVAEQAQVPA